MQTALCCAKRSSNAKYQLIPPTPLLPNLNPPNYIFCVGSRSNPSPFNLKFFGLGIGRKLYLCPICDPNEMQPTHQIKVGNIYTFFF